MSRNGDPDRVFAEDPATIRLNHEREVIAARLRELVDPRLSAALMPAEAAHDWPPDAVELHARYQTATNELSRLNSRQTSRQLSRFLRADTEDVEMGKAARRWWKDRY